MLSAATTVNVALVLCATALSGCGSQPSRTSRRAAQGPAGPQAQAETARSIQPPGRPAQPSDNNIRLTLHQQFGKAVFHECRLDIVTYEGAGGASVRCVRNVAPPTDLSRSRKLTAEEVNRLVGWVREGNLLAGGHIGVDGTASDGPPFETLRVTIGGDTGVLVTSGNGTFTTGARQRLLDWLQALLRELEESPK